jgi:hypothetical protein
MSKLTSVAAAVMIIMYSYDIRCAIALSPAVFIYSIVKTREMETVQKYSINPNTPVSFNHL